MTNYPESQLYGKLPLIAVKDFLKQIPEDFTVYQLWSHFGEFLKRYYGDNENHKIDETVMQRLQDSYKNQHHSGYSHGVATQAIMQYLGGQFDDEDKEFVKRGSVKSTAHGGSRRSV